MPVGTETTVGVNFVSQTQQALSGISSLERGLGRLASMGKMLGVVGASIFVGKKVTDAIKNVIDAGTTAEHQVNQLTVAFTEMSMKTGVPAATLAMNQYQQAVKFAAETPFDVNNVVNAAIRLRAIGIDPLAKDFKNLSGETVSVMKVLGNAAGDVNTFNRVMHNFSTAMVGSVLGMTLLERTTKLVPGTLKKATEGLRAGSEEFKRALIGAMARVPKFQNGMDLMAKSMIGIKSNIEDMADQFITSIADIQNKMGIYAKWKGILESFKNWLEANGDALKFFGKVIGMVLGQILDIVWALLIPIRSIVSAIGDFIAGFRDRMVTAVDDVSKKTDEVGGKMKSLATFAERLQLYISLTFGWLRVKIEEFYKSIKAFMDFLGVDATDVLLAFVALLGVKLVWAIGRVIVSAISLQGVLGMLSKVGIVLLVTQIISLIRNWEKLDGVGKAIRIGLIALTGVLTLFTMGLKGSATAIWLFSAALWACPITWIVLGIAALIAGIVLLIVYWDEVSAAISRFRDWLYSVGEAGDWLSQTFSGIADMIGGFMEYFEGMWDVIAGIFTLDSERILSGLGKMLDGAIAFFTGFVDIIIGLIRGLGVLILKGLTALGGVIIKFFGWIWKQIKEGFSAFVGGIVSLAESIWEYVSYPFRKVAEVVGEIFGGIGSVFGGVVDTIAEYGGKVIDAVVWPFKKAYQGIKDALGTVWDFLFGEEHPQREIKVSGTVTTKKEEPKIKKQYGGAVYKNRPYMVGEEGPETFIPNIAGMIAPAGKGGVVQSLNVNLSVDARGATDPGAVAEAIDVRLRLSLPEIARNWALASS